jgi:hypothetical protein
VKNVVDFLFQAVYWPFWQLEKEIMEERKLTTIRTLYETVTRYVDDNRRSGDVNERWLCAILEPMLGTISGVMNTKPRNEDLAAIQSFRAREIEKQIAEKRSEVERLERDLQNHQRSAT